MKDAFISREAVRNVLYEADAITMKGVAILNQFPAADAVEVVRCRECVFNEDKGKKQFYQWCCQSNKYRQPDWFCADGMREDVDNG